MRRQLRRLGLAHDPRRSFATTDPRLLPLDPVDLPADLQLLVRPRRRRPRRARPISELVGRVRSRRAGAARAARHVGGPGRAGERRDVVDGYRLAYVSEAPVNWCPGLGTVLANEEVTAEGRSERGNFPVFKRNLRQWMMRITAYADRLLDDLDGLDWPEPVKLHAAQLDRPLRGRAGALRRRPARSAIEVFTTRPDTLFGATFMVLAPEHPLVDALRAGRLAGGHARRRGPAGTPTPPTAVAAYRARGRRARPTWSGRPRAGRRPASSPGAFATNPVNGERIPVFIADYVLMGYGTGAIMAVPGQDERDWEFAARFELPIVRTVAAAASGWAGRGLHRRRRRSSTPPTTRSAWTAWASPRPRHASSTGWSARASARHGHLQAARLAVQPPALLGRAVPRSCTTSDGLRARPARDQLPVELPDVRDYSPRTFDAGRRRLRPRAPAGPRRRVGRRHAGPGRRAAAATAARPTPCPTGPARAGTTCATWTRPTRSRSVDPENERYWMGPRGTRDDGRPDPGGVDLYVGGVEHAVLHLLYARFWHKVLHDLGHVTQRGAVPPAVQPGHHPGLRLPRRPRPGRAGRRGRRGARRRRTPGRASRSPASTARWASR